MIIRSATFVASASVLFVVIFRHIPNFCLQFDPLFGVLLLEWVALSNPYHLRTSAE
jgi:hypothetical protein